MSFWSIAGPLASGLGSLFGGGASLLGARGLSQGDAMALSLSTAQDMYRYQQLNGPSFEMEGLRRAGINPMLRYGRGGSMPSIQGFSPGVVAPFNRFQGAADALGSLGGVASAFQSATGGDLNQANVRRSAADTRRLEQEALRIPAETARIEAATGLTDAQRNTEIERMSQVVAQTALARAQSLVPAAQMALFAAQISELSSREVVNTWNAALLGARHDLTMYQAGSARVQQERDSTTWAQDRQLLEDTVVGFVLRVLRNVSGAVQGR